MPAKRRIILLPKNLLINFEMDKYKSLRRKAKKERIKKRMCTDKVAYGSTEEAFQKGQRVYECPHCKMFHRSGKIAQLIAEVKKRPNF